VLGSTDFWHADSERTCFAIGRLLAGISKLVLLTGGVEGIGEAVGRSFFQGRLDSGQVPCVYHVLPEGEVAWDYGETLFAGADMTERREILGRLSGLFVLVEGGPRAQHEVDVALAHGAAIIPVGRSGGYAAPLYGRIRCPSTIEAGTWAVLGASESTPEDAARAVFRAVQGSWMSAAVDKVLRQARLLGRRGLPGLLGRLLSRMFEETRRSSMVRTQAQRVNCRQCRYRFPVQVMPCEDWKVEAQCPCCEVWACFTVADTFDPPRPNPEESAAQAQCLGEELWRPINDHRSHPATAWMDRVGNGMFEDDSTAKPFGIPTFWVYRFSRGKQAAYIWQEQGEWCVRGWHSLRGRRPPEPSRVVSLEAALDVLVR
jgi:hypothetical protein